MRKKLMTMALGLAVSSALMAQGNIVKLQAPARAAEADADDNPVETIIEEDFSLMKKGTNDKPDTEMFTEASDENYPYIADTLTHVPGWSGNTLYQAGGAVLINGGYLNTPEADFSGEVTLTCRMKNIGSKNAYVFITFCKGGIMNPQAVEEGVSGATVTVRKNAGWQDVEFKFTNNYGGYTFVQFNGALPQEDSVLLDDVKITSKVSFLVPPVMHSATDFKVDGFTASWDRMLKAEDYLLTVYEQVPLSDKESVDVTENFDGMTVTDGCITKAPEGWTLNLYGTPQVYSGTDDGLLGGTYSLRMSDDRDTIVTPYNGGMIKHFTIGIYKVQVAEDHNPKICVDVYDGTTWNSFGNFDVKTGIPDGFKPAQLLLDYNLGTTPRYYQIRLRCSDFEGTEVSFDDLEMTTTTPTRNDFVMTDEVVTDTFKVLTGLNPEHDYYYYVRSRNNTLGMTSPVPETVIYAFGVATPEVLEATDVDTRGSFTANWSRVPKATSYTVNLYKVYQADKAVSDYVVLDEDFNGELSSGDLETPFSIYNYSIGSLDGYAEGKDWYGRWNTAIEGAIGCEDKEDSYNQTGEIQSPELSLANGGGKFKVSLRVCGTAGEQLIVQNSAGYWNYVTLTEDWKDVTLDLQRGCDNDILVFFAYSGHKFFIDRVTVTQDLTAGERVWHKRDIVTLEGNDATSQLFSDIAEEDNVFYAYDVTAIYEKNSNTAYSEKSDRMIVDLYEVLTGIGGVEADKANVDGVMFYDLTGRPIGQSIAGHKGVFIRKSNGETKKIIVR